MSRYLLLLVFLSAGCADSAPPAPAMETMVYFDTALKAAVLRPKSAEIPAVNPDTGKRTLMPAVWCSGCDAWHAAPPLEEVQRNPDALICPKTRTRMSPLGPEP